MSEQLGVAAKVKSFIEEVKGEIRKCTWPEKQELLESTIVVIVSVLLMALFVGVSDMVLVKLLKILVPVG